VGFEDFWKVPQMVDNVVQATLGDLKGREPQDAVSQLGRVEVRSEAGDDAPLLKSVKPRLHGAPGYAKLAGQLQHADPRRVSHDVQQPGVQLID
jgi:hypothetical protein